MRAAMAAATRDAGSAEVLQTGGSGDEVRVETGGGRKSAGREGGEGEGVADAHVPSTFRVKSLYLSFACWRRGATSSGVL